MRTNTSTETMTVAAALAAVHATTESVRTVARIYGGLAPLPTTCGTLPGLPEVPERATDAQVVRLQGALRDAIKQCRAAMPGLCRGRYVEPIGILRRARQAQDTALVDLANAAEAAGAPITATRPGMYDSRRGISRVVEWQSIELPDGGVAHRTMWADGVGEWRATPSAYMG